MRILLSELSISVDVHLYGWAMNTHSFVCVCLWVYVCGFMCGCVLGHLARYRHHNQQARTYYLHAVHLGPANGEWILSVIVFSSMALRGEAFWSVGAHTQMHAHKFLFDLVVTGFHFWMGKCCKCEIVICKFAILALLETSQFCKFSTQRNQNRDKDTTCVHVWNSLCIFRSQWRCHMCTYSVWPVYILQVLGAQLRLRREKSHAGSSVVICCLATIHLRICSPMITAVQVIPMFEFWWPKCADQEYSTLAGNFVVLLLTGHLTPQHIYEGVPHPSTYLWNWVEIKQWNFFVPKAVEKYEEVFFFSRCASNFSHQEHEESIYQV